MARSADTKPSPALLARARAGDRYARDSVVRALLPLARRVAHRFAGSQNPVEDLAQVALIGLLKAIERFDPAREASFTTYAHALMTGEVRRHLRDSRMVRIPRGIDEQLPAFRREQLRLHAQLGREPTRDELAAGLGLTKEEIVELVDAELTASHTSLDAAADASGGELQLGADDEAFAGAEAGAVIHPMLSALTPRERTVLELRFAEGLTQSEIAAGLGVSPTQVSRVIRGALAKLSKRAGARA